MVSLPKPLNATSDRLFLTTPEKAGAARTARAVRNTTDLFMGALLPEIAGLVIHHFIEGKAPRCQLSPEGPEGRRAARFCRILGPIPPKGRRPCPRS